MFEAVREQTLLGVKAYDVTEREKWVLQWPGMVVLVVTCIAWTQGVQNAIGQVLETPEAVKKYEEKCTQQLMNVVELVRGQLSKLEVSCLLTSVFSCAGIAT